MDYLNGALNKKDRSVVVTQRFFDPAAIAYLEANGCSVHIVDLPQGQADNQLTRATLHGLLSGADGWIVGHAAVDHDLLAPLGRLQVVARRGVGHERIDLAAIRALGKVATIAVGGNDACVADHVLGMMLALGHRMRDAQSRMSGGDWTIVPGHDLYRKKVGIVGLGRIGRAVVQRLRGFEADIFVVTPSPARADGQENKIRYVDLETMLAECDYVSLHAPLTQATRLMIDAAAMRRMKPGAFLLNTARGGLVDDAALLAALQSGQIAGAGLDVFQSETDPALHEVTRALLALPNVVATPHSGASTHEGLERTNLIAARCVVAVLDGSSIPASCLVADGRPDTGAPHA
jgi:D-3-phosphoglycerate dehydrogenase